MAEPFTKAYVATMSSVNALELRCEEDEAELFARIISLEIAKDDGTDVTAGKYEEDLEGTLGNLAIEKYKTDVDVTSLKAIHKTKGDTFLFKGEAYIQSQRTKVLVFREKS